MTPDNGDKDRFTFKRAWTGVTDAGPELDYLAHRYPDIPGLKDARDHINRAIAALEVIDFDHLNGPTGPTERTSDMKDAYIGMKTDYEQDELTRPITVQTSPAAWAAIADRLGRTDPDAANLITQRVAETLNAQPFASMVTLRFHPTIGAYVLAIMGRLGQ